MSISTVTSDPESEVESSLDAPADPAPADPASAKPHDPVRLHELHSTESDFRRRFPLLWWGTLVGPFVFTLLLIAGLWLYAGPEMVGRVLGNVALTLWVLGRFVILQGSEDGVVNGVHVLTSGQLFLLVLYLDVVVALVLAFHIGFLFRIPYFGQRFLSLVEDGHFVLDLHPWIRRATLVGLMTFVSFPLTATGSMGGSILGRLLGMSRLATFSGIVIGSTFGNGVMYVISEWLSMVLDKDHPVIKYGGLVVIVLAAVILERRYRYLRNEFHADEVAAKQRSSAAGTSEPGDPEGTEA